MRPSGCAMSSRTRRFAAGIPSSWPATSLRHEHGHPEHDVPLADPARKLVASRWAHFRHALPAFGGVLSLPGRNPGDRASAPDRAGLAVAHALWPRRAVLRRARIATALD